MKDINQLQISSKITSISDDTNKSTVYDNCIDSLKYNISYCNEESSDYNFV